MLQYVEKKFTGERALFQSSDLKLDFCTFGEGESPLKESRNLEINHSTFGWKYPLWYSNQIKVHDSTLLEMARAGIWYSNHIQFHNVTIEAPKSFRRCSDLVLRDVVFTKAEETLWNCSQVKMSHVTAKGDYFAMGCRDMEIDGFTLVGNYGFDGVKNLVIRNAKLLTKDAFWNCENVTVYDSYISGEYLGWNSKNVKLVNCVIDSLQGMCYMENLILENCKLLNTDLAFEYSSVDATVEGKIVSVKNPYSGKIVADEIEEIIFDNPEMNKKNTLITERKKNISLVV